MAFFPYKNYGGHFFPIILENMRDKKSLYWLKVQEKILL